MLFRGRRLEPEPRDHREARRIARERVAEVVALGHAELSRYQSHCLACEVLGRDDRVYAHELTVVDGGSGALQVFVEVYAQDSRTRKWDRKHVTHASGLLNVDGSAEIWPAE